MKIPDKSQRVGEFIWSAWKLRIAGDLPCLSAWIVYCPRKDWAWSYWVVSVAHLRDTEGFPSATKHYSGAEHEFCIYTLDPSKPFPEFDNPQFNVLEPPDVVFQFDGLSDPLVIDLCGIAVEAIVRGQLMPDKGSRSDWLRILQVTIRKYKEGSIDLRAS